MSAAQLLLEHVLDSCNTAAKLYGVLKSVQALLGMSNDEGLAKTLYEKCVRAVAMLPLFRAAPCGAATRRLACAQHSHARRWRYLHARRPLAALALTQLVRAGW